MPCESPFAPGSGKRSEFRSHPPGSRPRTAAIRPPRTPCGVWISVALSLVAGFGTFAASNDAGAGRSPTNSIASTNAPSPNVTNTFAAIPQSILTIPKTRKEGVDPFFPLSIRVAATETVNPTNRVTVMGELVIQGFSGRPEAPLVIINNRTFGIGEDGDVTTPQGRMRVRCVDIQLKTESAVVEVNKERRELRFRSNTTIEGGVRRTDR